MSGQIRTLIDTVQRISASSGLTIEQVADVLDAYSLAVNGTDGEKANEKGARTSVFQLPKRVQ